MNLTLAILHFVAGLIVVAEGLNKAERMSMRLRERGVRLRHRFSDVLKAVAWVLLVLGGGGAVITPLLHLERPTLQDVCVVVGFAVLIVRTRFKEG